MSMIKAISSKAVVIRINLVFLACFLVIYAVLLLRPSSSSTYRESATSFVRCSFRECHHKEDQGIKMKAMLESKLGRRKNPSFLNEMGNSLKIGMVNMDGEDMSDWETHGKTIKVEFEKVSELFEWKDLFPEWIDEEEEYKGPSCPEIPMPLFENYENMDIIIANLPCEFPKQGWGRDVFRLQIHLIVANLVVKNGKKGLNGKIKVVFLSKCRPMMEIFRCDDLVRKEGEWWLFEPEVDRLEQKISLPIGSCDLALPLWEKGIDTVYNVSKIEKNTGVIHREAYATVLHSSESYVCGAITLAQSLLKSGTKRDLILLVDNSISIPKREALAGAGWKIRLIKRIRNPRAEKDSYNEYNYSKFRLWQLTNYDKIIFIDADIIILRNMDLLFHFPQMTAVGNDASIFNSGIMVLEPSNCTFDFLMRRRKHIISYNGGDQGYLNEVFFWWHRLPRRVNFLKNFWSNSTIEKGVKNQLFASDLPKLYSIHYLGLKPWQCYRDYDCNYDIEDQVVYASDVAHTRWWKLHDSMDAKLQKFCGLTEKRKIELKWDRKKARERGTSDEHCRINVTDTREFVRLDI